MQSHQRRYQQVWPLSRQRSRRLRVWTYVALSFAVGSIYGENRTIDGAGNNVSNPTWGAANTPLLRLAPADYEDGISAPAGNDRPSPRLVSNTLAAQSTTSGNSLGLSNFVWQWGQFLDHDIDLTGGASPVESFNIAVPAGDPHFDPGGTGEQEIFLNRSVFDPGSGTDAGNPRQQLNQITSYIDASNIYGSDANRAAALRDTGGLLTTTAGGLLPMLNTVGEENDNANPSLGPADLFLSGDVRVNEHVGLTSMHAIFVREHNRLAADIATNNPGLSDDDIYERARKIVGAEMQIITYNEFLPALLGSHAPGPDSSGYDPGLDASISTEFSTALYRLGHSMLPEHLSHADNTGQDAGPGDLPLQSAFFNPNHLLQAPENVDLILRGLSLDMMEEVDNLVIDDVRNFLFGPPGAGGFDLASLNIQRGRDHGLADYNTTRVAYGLNPVASFADITGDTDLQLLLEDVYGDVDNIDLWAGALAEDPFGGSGIGELLAVSLADEFTRLRDGDRFWYQHDSALDGILAELGMTISDLESTTLATIIMQNSTVTGLQDNVFFVPAAIPEPRSLVLFASMLASLIVLRRKR